MRSSVASLSAMLTVPSDGPKPTFWRNSVSVMFTAHESSLRNTAEPLMSSPSSALLPTKWHPVYVAREAPPCQLPPPRTAWQLVTYVPVTSTTEPSSTISPPPSLL